MISMWSILTVTSIDRRLIEDDSTLFRDLADRQPSLAVAPELLCYLGHHPEGENESTLETGQTQSPARAKWAISRAEPIKQLIDHQACTQTEPDDVLEPQQSKKLEQEAELTDKEEGLPFPECLDDSSDRDTDGSGPDYLVRATDESKQASSALQALINLCDVELANEHEQDPNLRLPKDMIRNSPERPSWEHVCAECAQVKALWSQYANLKIRAGTLLRRHKNQGIFGDWQIVAPQMIHTRIFQACHHHKLAAHQGIVRTLALIKRWLYWRNMQKDIEAWCQRCAMCGKCKVAVRGQGQLQQPMYGTFNERVSVDLMGPYERTQDDNEYIVVIQDHFTKWVGGRAICGKEALTVTDAIVQEWVLKHGAPISLQKSSPQRFIKKFVICCELPKRTLQHTGHKPMVWWNAVIEHSWQCYKQ